MKTIKKLLIIVAAILAISAFAQPPIANPAEKMKALTILTGNWSGGGWMFTEDRKRVEFTQKEEIGFELNETILKISGHGFNLEGKQIHNALGIMFFDTKENKYYMDAFLATGQHTLAEIALTEKGLDWSFQTEQGGTVKYVITIEKDTWIEKGFYSPDGVSQYPFIEFTLARQ
jgi:hypothetical protein